MQAVICFVWHYQEEKKTDQLFQGRSRSPLCNVKLLLCLPDLAIPLLAPGSCGRDWGVSPPCHRVWLLALSDCSRLTLQNLRRPQTCLDCRVQISSWYSAIFTIIVVHQPGNLDLEQFLVIKCSENFCSIICRPMNPSDGSSAACIVSGLGQERGRHQHHHPEWSPLIGPDPSKYCALIGWTFLC